jgi:kynurenine formamidase
MNLFPVAAISFVTIFTFAGAVMAEEHIHPSPFGPDDQAGASNLITPEKVRDAAALITDGNIYQLARTFDGEMPLFGARAFALRATGGLSGGPVGDNNVIWNDEFLSTEIGQVGTQFDGLAHIGIRTPDGDRYYNNFTGEQIHGPQGMAMLGIEHVKPFFTRGVLVDLVAHKGEMLDAGYEVTVEDITGALEAQGLDPDSIGEGEVVLLHTGWGSLWGEDNRRFNSGAPGIGMDAARWLAEKRVAIVGSDTWPVEVVPNPDSSLAFPVHQELIVRNGIFIYENVATERLADAEVYEFAFSFTPMPIRGATGAPGNALAIR